MAIDFRAGNSPVFPAINNELPLLLKLNIQPPQSCNQNRVGDSAK